MANRSSVKVTGLGDAITKELTLYHTDVTEKVNRIGEASIKMLTQMTRKTAPKGKRGDFRKSIASKVLVKKSTGNTYVWYVKSPNHRLTHLLVKGHATRNGGRTKADPFLQNAVDTVIPDYEKAVERTLSE